MRDLWAKRVVSARAAVAKDGVQFTTVKDFSPYVRKMSPLYGKYMADPAVRADLSAVDRLHPSDRGRADPADRD